MLQVNQLIGFGVDSGLDNARSLDFEAGSSQALSRSWGAGGTSRRRQSYMFWYKRESIGADMVVFSGGQNTGDNDVFISITSTNKVRASVNIGAVANVMNKISTATFTDTASWHRLLVAFDTDQATANDRCRIYHDGTEITAFDTNTNIAQNTDLPVNGYNATHYIGRLNFTAASYFDGLLDEIHFIDGTQCVPADFEAGGAPINFAGTYGTKGFRLRFEDTGSLGTDDSGNGNNWTLVNTPVTSTDHP